jgi:hypothetical protein
VLAKKRRRHGMIHRRRGEPHRACDRKAGDARRVRDLDPHAAVAHLRVLEPPACC